MGRITGWGSWVARLRWRTGLSVFVTLASLAAAAVVAAPSASAAGSPTVTGLSPNSLPQGVAAKSATLTGTNFVSGAEVTSHAGITATAVFVSSTQLSVAVDVARTVPVGSYSLFVTNPDNSVGACINCLTVTVGDFPTVTSLSPNLFSPGVAAQAATLNGSNFASGSTVTSHAGVTLTTTYVNPTTLSLTVTVSPTVPSGFYDIFVTNPDNSLGSCINCLSIGASSVPATSGKYVGIASLSDGTGYWLADSSGDVFAHGSATNFGSMAGHPLNAPISHIVATADGGGYWLVAADGGTFTFGDAGFFGSMGGQHLNAPVVDIAPTSTGRGYWLVASDGGIFAFGDAQFFGSMGGSHLNKPVVGMSVDNSTGGYWLVASDGGIFAFAAPFLGSTGAIRLNKPVNGMAATSTNLGYWLVASDGGIFSFGDAQFQGSAGAIQLNAPVVGMAPDLASGGYWLVASDGGVFSYDAPFYGAQ